VCYPCSECCGASSNNIEPQCVSSRENLRIGTRIGEKGALHCKVTSSQQCDGLLQEDKDKVHVTPDTKPSPSEKKLSRPFDSTDIHTKPIPSEKKLSRPVDITDIVLKCCLALSLAVNLLILLLYLRGRKGQHSSHSSPFFFSSFPCSLSSAGMS